jgi:hypothetical protein
MCGCGLPIGIPAASASRRRRRVAAGGGVPVHPGVAAVAQDRSAGAVGEGAVDGPAGRGRQRDQHDLAAFAAHAQDPVAVFLAEVGDVGAGGFEDPQAEQSEHGHQGEVMPAGGLAGGAEQGPELQAVNPRVGDSSGTAGRRTCSAGDWSRTPSMTQVRWKPAVTGEPPRYGGGLVPAGFLHPPDVQLQVRAARGQRVQPTISAPGQVAAQAGVGVVAGGAGEPGQAGRHRQPELAGKRRRSFGRDGDQFIAAGHALTLRPIPPPPTSRSAPGAA